MTGKRDLGTLWKFQGNVDFEEPALPPNQENLDALDETIIFVNTCKHIADILTKGSFSRERWSQLTQTTHALLPSFYSSLFVFAGR